MNKRKSHAYEHRILVKVLYPSDTLAHIKTFNKGDRIFFSPQNNNKQFLLDVIEGVSLRFNKDIDSKLQTFELIAGQTIKPFCRPTARQLELDEIPESLETDFNIANELFGKACLKGIIYHVCERILPYSVIIYPINQSDSAELICTSGNEGSIPNRFQQIKAALRNGG